MTSKVLLTILGFLLLASAILFVYKKINYIDDVVIVNDTSVGPEWRTYDLATPFVITKDSNKVNIDPLPPYQVRPGWTKIKAPDGTEFLPEVEVVSESGEVVPLKYAGGRFYREHTFVNFDNEDGLIKGFKIRQLRIRSSHELAIRTIWFSSYDIKDLP